MKKLDLHRPFLDLDGKPIQGPTMARFLAEAIANTALPANRLVLWKAGKLVAASCAVYLIDEDLAALKWFVEGVPNVSTLMAGQLLEAIDAACANPPDCAPTVAKEN